MPTLRATLLPLVFLASLHAQSADHPLHVGGEVHAPSRLSDVEPNFSDVPADELQKLGCFSVMAHMVVDEQGIPQQVSLERSYGSDAVDAAIRQAFQSMRYRPGTLKDKPVAVRLSVSISDVGKCS